MPEDNRIDVSVVIIARNEEEMIADCLDSVFGACRYAQEKGVLDSYEVILSDSASTDRTVEIARKYPVKIVQLKKEWTLSAPAGRYIGSLYARGEFIFFTDGDCKTDREWFVRALPVFRDKTVGGVDGYEREHIAAGNFFHPFFKDDERINENTKLVEPEFIGKGIFRRDAYEKAGRYNPWLKGCEERDLSFRVRKLGFKLLRLPCPCTLHHWAKKSGELKYWTVVRTIKGWSLGDGGVLRHNIGDPEIVRDIRRRNFNFRMIINYLPGVLLLELLLLNLWGVLVFPGTGFIVAVLSDMAFLGILAMLMVRERSGIGAVLYRHFQQVPYSILRQGYIILGFLTAPKLPSGEYPKDAVVLESGKTD
jgi:glycosyltransferase involved in cell wall biosynthesis